MRRASGRHVLVVEDDAQLLGLARVALAESGFWVEAAEDGASAFRALDRLAASFDAVVLDLNLGDMPGRAVLVRARQLRPDLPVIVATGERVSDVPGADAVVRKPYGPSDIVAALDASIARRRAAEGATS